MDGSTFGELMAKVKALEEEAVAQVETAKSSAEAEKASVALVAKLTKEKAGFEGGREKRTKEVDASLAKARKDMDKAAKVVSDCVQVLEKCRIEAGGVAGEVADIEKLISASEDSLVGLRAAVDDADKAHKAKKETYATVHGEVEAERQRIAQADADIAVLTARVRDSEKKLGDAEVKAKKIEGKRSTFDKAVDESRKVVETYLAAYAWIATERQFFGKEGTDYDFGKGGKGSTGAGEWWYRAAA
jgi:structural maintenance of chromosome 2